ncbi:unnamed protein product [Ectocarpus sp. 12 AP-2014]
MSWEHDAQKYGRQLPHAASKRYSGDLPVLSGEDTAKCTVLEAAGDGIAHFTASTGCCTPSEIAS